MKIQHRQEAPIATCTFGWGQQLHLYRDYLDVDGRRYPLTQLTQVSSTQRRVLGVDSVRLDLRFGKKHFFLRGIPEVESARQIVAYLKSHYLDLPQVEEVKEQAVTDGRTPTREQRIAREEPVLPHEQVTVEEVNLARERYITLLEQAPTAKATAISPNGQPFRHEQRKERKKHIQVASSLRESGFEAEKLAQRFQEGILPTITVPVRLLPGEKAHYSSDVTLCGEPIGSGYHSSYTIKDRGMMILTNKRMIYIGRKSQLVLDYARLLQISRLPGAIAFQAENWYRREIFELPRPLECVTYLESILEHFHEETSWSTVDTENFEEYPDGVTEECVPGSVDTMPLSLRSWRITDEQEPTVGTLDVLAHQHEWR